MSTQYLLNGEWVSLERFRKAKGIGQSIEQSIGQSIEKEKEVIEVKEEKVEIIEPEIKIKNKKK